MYDRAIRDARESAGADTETIAGYQTAFDDSLPEKALSIPARKILETIDSHQFLLFGDFHSHKQSQRAFLRLLRMYMNRPDHAPVIVMLEMFRSKDQHHLDNWLSGRINDQELLDAINYDQTWGFPWNNYRPILEYCKYQNIHVIGLNTSRGGRDSLATRDQHASMLISGQGRQNKHHKVFCMIGEFHLANQHLPQALKKQLSTSAKDPIRVFNNLDKYYFDLDPDKIHHRDEYLSLSASTFCIINSPPWIKWQSQSLWEEIRRLGPMKYLEDAIAPDDIEADLAAWEDDDEDLYNDDVLDLDYHLTHLQKQLCDFFKIKITTDKIQHFNIVHGNIDDDLADLCEPSRLQTLSDASSEGFSVNYEARLVYMTEISINNMAAAAGQMLFGSLTNLKENFEDQESLFIVQCLKSTFGYITNKILNPRLPLNTIRQLESYILSTKGKRLSGSMKQRRNSAQSTLKVLDWMQEYWIMKNRENKKFRRMPKTFFKTNASSQNEIARSLAQLIAEPVCRSLIRGKIDTVDIQRWLLRDCRDLNDAIAALAALIALTNS
jgi:hypothetical protein